VTEGGTMRLKFVKANAVLREFHRFVVTKRELSNTANIFPDLVYFVFSYTLTFSPARYTLPIFNTTSDLWGNR